MASSFNTLAGMRAQITTPLLLLSLLAINTEAFHVSPLPLSSPPAFAKLPASAGRVVKANFARSVRAVGSFIPETNPDARVASTKDAPVLQDPIILEDPTTKERVTVRMDGAHVQSYMTPDYDVFFTRPDAVFDGSKPVSGGVPICWPQFGPGDMQQHGFARNLKWECTDVRAERPGGMTALSWSRNTQRAVYELIHTKETLKMWDSRFQARYQVELSGGSLNLELRVHNKGVEPLTFTGALHTYFSVDDLEKLQIKGPFKGKKYLDKTCDPVEEKEETEGAVKIDGFTERVYQDVAGKVTIEDGDKSVVLRCSEEWSDLAIWNPYGEEKMGYKGFVCVEHGVIATPVTVQPDDIWVATVSITPTRNGLPAWTAAQQESK